MADKIYVGSGKKQQYGIGISICLTDLPPEYMFEYGDKKYIKLIVNEKREVDQYGKTHYVQVDTWKPNETNSTEDEEVTGNNDDPSKTDDSDGLPF